MVKKIIGIVSHEINSNRSKDLEEVLYDVLPNYEIIEKKHEPMKIEGSWKKELKRDIVLIEFLYSTGVRVSELTSLDRNDVNFEKMEVVVYGKGGKEREVYLTPTARMYLSEYLNSREDEKGALFVSARKPWERIGKEGVEAILKRLGVKSGVEKVHPHRFRRTMATNILNKGMPIEEVKEILGHSKLDTTMIYCKINKENIKHHHKKYMS